MNWGDHLVLPSTFSTGSFACLSSDSLSVLLGCPPSPSLCLMTIATDSRRWLSFCHLPACHRNACAREVTQFTALEGHWLERGRWIRVGRSDAAGASRPLRDPPALRSPAHLPSPSPALPSPTVSPRAFPVPLPALNLTSVLEPIPRASGSAAGSPVSFSLALSSLLCNVQPPAEEVPLPPGRFKSPIEGRLPRGGQ